MEMIIHLDSDIFDIVKNNSKDVEIRVNDEKRRKLKVGDTLVFLKRPNDDEELRATITDLVYFNNFLEVVDNYPMKRIYLDEYTKEDFVNLISRFYSEEEVNKYGVVAIEFELDK